MPRCGHPNRSNDWDVDKTTGMSSDEYVGAAWSCRDKHYMMNLVVCIRQLVTKTAKLPTGGEKLVTNVIACNNSLYEIQLSGRDVYAEQLAQMLKVGEVEILKPSIIQCYIIGVYVYERLCQVVRECDSRNSWVHSRISLWFGRQKSHTLCLNNTKNFIINAHVVLNYKALTL